ncbi:MAG: Asp-tRNA(Asn)/Glu-tRNA(Gln) amidotransferase subunit GatB [Candidatus Saganbacteria bacterium]|nr:Asp-tRNA(Asn)/Glu-tRNA(Gln) amidotransferase subunit GatB [Candidatus Saganbacteria bacterium]
MSKYESVIGLEIHAQLLTESKIFCSCSTTFGNEPNRNICPVCTGQPGVLPVLNKKVVEFAIKTALALHCQIAPYSIFARKQYFYPDLPKDFQISQYELPLATNGYVEINVNGNTRCIRIHRIHLEEDAGKLVHAGSDRIQGSTYSLVDFNRTGVPLMEIVSEPDMATPEEARAYVQEIAALLKSLGVCDAKMEEGSLRCDGNVSIRPVGDKNLGTKTEVKNVNSTKALKDALDAEIVRQIKAVDAGERIIQETRHFNENTGQTISLRSKEEAHDYRYFPEPDLVPLEVSKEWIDEIKQGIGELPAEKIKRYVEQFGIKTEDVETILESPGMAEFFEGAIRLYGKPQIVANWLTGEISAYLNAKKLEIKNSKLKISTLVGMLALIDKGTISGKIAKEVIVKMLDTGKSAEEIVKESGATQISDEGELIKAIQEVIKNNPKPVQDYKDGKKASITFLVGQVMKVTKGRAKPDLVNKLLEKELS